jgi:hypothetical protein
MAVTVEQIKRRVETTLSDEDLGALIAAAYEAIAKSDIGPPGPVTELLTADAGDLLMLSRSAATVTSIIERKVTLAADDYDLATPNLLVRLATGTHPASCWRGRVEVTYPVDDDSERDRIAAELVALDVTHKAGLTSIRIGEFAETYAANSVFNYEIEREAILASYQAGGGAFV